MLQPDQLSDGMRVVYHPSPGLSFPAVVSGDPWQLGGHTWVVRLIELPPEYAEKTGKTHARTHVPAAALFSLTKVSA